MKKSASYLAILSQLLCVALMSTGCNNGTTDGKTSNLGWGAAPRVELVPQTSVIDTQHFEVDALYDISCQQIREESEEKDPKRIRYPRKEKLPNGKQGVCGIKMPVSIKTAGAYKVCFEYSQLWGAYENVSFRVYRKSDWQTVRFQLIDYHSAFPGIPSSPVPEAHTFPAKWASIPVNFECPGEYVVEVSGTTGVRNADGRGGWGAWSAAPAVAELWVSNDPAFTPSKPSNVTDVPVVQPEGGEGFQLATVHPRTAKLNTVLSSKDRLQLCLHECYPYFMDFAAAIDWGVNLNHQGTHRQMYYETMDTPVTGDVSFGPDREFYKKYPWPEGRAANSRGEYVRDYSFSFKPYRDACYQAAVNSIKWQVSQPGHESVVNWKSSWEQCGTYDYGKTSVNAFRHEYLPKKYGTLENLNKKWHQDYKSWDDIVPPTYYDCVGKYKIKDELKLARAKACFLDFRDFNSKEYASWLGLKTKAIQQYDPLKRNMSSAYSNNNLGSICWLKWRPLSFEDTMRLTMMGSGTMGWDIYGTDDLVATAFEHFYAFSNDKTIPMIKEANIHAMGNELTVRTFYALFAEGMRGMAFFTAQESPKPELRKFGMANPDDDMAPRPKMAALADTFRALQQIEPFMAFARRRPVGKPVAIFYSQNNNIMQDRGYGSMFDCAPDSHMRVFEMIRACGYPCTIITEQQIMEGERLDQISAIFFIDAQYLEDAMIDKLRGWIEKGGHIVADAQTGCYDAHGFPSTKMIDLLGIKPIKRERIDEKVAEQLTFGYSSQAFEAVNPDELWLTMREYIHQRDTKHPIAKAAGKIMISGFGAQDVKSLDGEVIILGNNGEVGWNIRNIGKGTASYFAGYLGTIYGAGCTQYEWRDAHSDDSPYRWFESLLTYFGAKKNAETSLEEHIHVRYGSPLVDPDGNMLSVFTNYSDHCLPSFKARTFLPKGVDVPKMMLVTSEGSRKIEQIDFMYNKELNALEYEMPGFRVFANVMQIQAQKYPMLSVECLAGDCRDEYRLPDFRPGMVMTFKTKVYNTTGKALKPGKITLRLPDGWFYDKESIDVPFLAPYASSDEFTFQVKAPSVCAARRVRPINFIYTSEDVTSTPSVEMVWFQNEPQLKKDAMH